MRLTSCHCNYLQCLNWVCRLALTQLKAASGQSHDQLLAARNTILGLAAQDSRLAGVRPNGQEDTPQYRVIVDHAQAGALGVSVAEINSTMGMAGRFVYQ